MGFGKSDVGQFLRFISVLVDLGQRPDEARPLVGFGHADLLQKDKRRTRHTAREARFGKSLENRLFSVV